MSAVFEIDEAAAEAAARLAQGLTVWAHGRRPAFWGDLEVRVFVTALHRQATAEAVVAACRARFGGARTPSRSAVARYWLRLDRAMDEQRRAR